MIEVTSGDFLAGGGGVTEAMTRIPGLTCQWVLNHDQMAIRTNMFNHQGIQHYWSDLYTQDEHKMKPVDFIWASIECTQHSRANGGRAKKVGSYTLGWELIRYLKHLQPLIIGIENVPEFKDWSPVNANGTPVRNKKGEEFQRWKKAICDLGYIYHEKIMNAADYGIPTRRVRYFAFFVSISLAMEINWPEPTHSKKGTDGLKKWEPCRPYLDLNNEGESIFGRKLNPNVRKGKRIPLSVNTLRRIAGGIKKLAPEIWMILQYYGNGFNGQKLSDPLNTITTKDRHILIKVEKLQFIQDHCRTDIYSKPDEPLGPQLTRQTKQVITLEKKQMLGDYYGRDDTAHSIEGPCNAITTENSKHLITTQLMMQYYGGDNHSSSLEVPLPSITTKDHNALLNCNIQFVSPQYNSNGNPENNVVNLEDPLWALSTEEKFQFISAYFNSSGHPETQNQDINNPLNSILGTGKQALITAIKNGQLDFDIKMRFLDPEEMSRISTFPDKYFTNPRLKLTKKQQVKLIGNAVPPEWARLIIQPVIQELQEVMQKKEVI